MFYHEFTTILETIAVYSCHICISGDLNIHVNDSKDINAIKFLEILDSFGLTQSVQGSTHIKGHTLDLVITRSDNLPPVIRVELPLSIFSFH